MANAAENALMRAELKTFYTSDDWCRKVDKMGDKQLFAVWRKLKNQNRF